MKKFSKSLKNIQDSIVSKLFWGRNSLYKTVVHSVMVLATILVFTGGIFNRINANNSSQVLGISNNDDILSSGSAVQALDAFDTATRVKTYTVQNGDTVQSVAQKFKLKPETIRWSNLKEIGPFSDSLHPGLELKIPYTDGVLYHVNQGDTIYSLASSMKSDVFTISEINGLQAPDYKLPVGQDIMIPDGRLQSQDIGNIVTVTEDNLVGAFADPLSNPACNGYHFYGGINSYPGHNGVDAGLPQGCPIRAIAAGTVYYAGWEDYGSGYTIKIDHGGGVKSYYYHGNGEIWVKAGQYVEQGTDLMMMGCTGNCFGTHLHLTIRLNGQVIDPMKYVPYKVNP